MSDVQIKTELGNDEGLDPLEKNILVERYEFYHCVQQSEETFYAFLENIRNLAETCEFHKDEKDFLIRDRFVFGINDKRIQSAILATGGNPSIDAVVECCMQAKDNSKNDIKTETKAETNITDKANDTNVQKAATIDDNPIGVEVCIDENVPGEVGLNDNDEFGWADDNDAGQSGKILKKKVLNALNLCFVFKVSK